MGHRPRLRVPNADDGTHGRGLILVQSLADAWGVRVHGVGKVVWFELDGEWRESGRAATWHRTGQGHGT